MIPRPTLEQAKAKLQHLDEWKLVLDLIRELREESIADLGNCKDPYDTMKLTGGAARLDELFGMLKS